MHEISLGNGATAYEENWPGIRPFLLEGNVYQQLLVCPLPVC